MVARMQETEEILADPETLADLRQSRDDYESGDTFSADQVRAELARRRAGWS
jgi:antitoxin YefM